MKPIKKQIQQLFNTPFIQYIALPLLIIYIGYTIGGSLGGLIGMLVVVAWRVYRERELFKVLWLGLKARQMMKQYTQQRQPLDKEEEVDWYGEKDDETGR